MRISYWFKDVQMFESLAVTMRTPGHDRELVAGFLLSEGVIRSREDLFELRSLGTDPSNEILAELSKNVDFDAWKLSRSSVVNSSCGICGKRTREAIASQIPRPINGNLRVDRSLISKLPDLLRERQEGFAKTGGLHAAALVNACRRDRGRVRGYRTPQRARQADRRLRAQRSNSTSKPSPFLEQPQQLRARSESANGRCANTSDGRRTFKPCD